jgi:tol-pal system beta propeller repeat protein TolB
MKQVHGKAAGTVIAAVAFAALLMASSAQAAFPGHNGRLVLAPAPEDAPPTGALRTIAPQGTDLRLLPIRTASNDSAPAYSPDGTKIAYVADSTGTVLDGGDSELYIANADGTGARRVTRTAGLERTPSWSPDGTKLVYAVAAGLDTARPTSEIWQIATNGTGARRLSAAGARDYEPAWSPNGLRIAFSSDRTGGREIFSMAAAGGDVRRLTVDADTDDQPAWSPDSKRIVFVSNVETFTGAELWSMNADGSGTVRLTRDTVPQADPVYSPDGKWIAYSTQCQTSCESHQVWRIASNGTDPRYLALGVQPDWQRLF